MKTIGYTIVLFLLSQYAYSQKNLDNIWLFGYSNGASSPIFGSSVMDFNNDTLIMYTHDRDMLFDATNSSICDKNGDLLFYTNGIFIANFLHDTIENGEAYLNPDIFFQGPVDSQRLPQGAITLPFPGQPNEYCIIHEALELVNLDFLDIGGEKIFYHHINMNANNGNGIVVEKNIPILEDTLDNGKLTATRHANGRDWWLTVPEFRSNLYYKMLLTPEGISVDTQRIGEPVANGLGQAVFAPDGSVYANITLNNFVDCAAHIYRFDRCTGELYDPVYIPITCNVLSTGAAISPNSRFLYLLVNDVIYQVDLWSDDWEASMQEVAVYDGYEEPIPIFEDFSLQTRFFLGQLAPNGKIYINTTNSVRSLHVINEPDSLGLACDVQQHALQLPTLNAFSLPNFPNYKLRAEQGSECDTLGPVAFFTETPLGLEIQFLDESTNDPNAWEWDFGDNASSSLQSPTHVYSNPGEYNVCLTASNDYSSSTFCNTINVLTTSSEVIDNNFIAVKMYPTPVIEHAYLEIKNLLGFDKQMELIIYNTLGQVVHQQEISIQQNQVQEIIGLHHLNAGMYSYSLNYQNKQIANGKLVKI